MKIKRINHKHYHLILLSLSLALAGCGGDQKTEEAKTAPTAKTESTTFDHTHGPEVTDLQKHKFEHDFAAQCVERELNDSANQIDDADRINKSCECIATYMMKDLTAQEAEKFINEKEHPQSLRIKFEAAAYECLQEKAKPEGPKLFGKQN
jgi:hypothetical protein